MKKGLLAVPLLLALSAGPAVAEILTVNVTAHVVQVDDPGNILGGQISVGQVAQGSYRYETTVPDNASWSNEWGSYVQTREQGGTSITVGPHIFETDSAAQGYWMYHVQVYGSLDPSMPDSVTIASQNNKPLADGSSVSYLSIDFTDVSGAALDTDQLPAGALNLANFASRTINISGSDPTYMNSWYVTLEIDSVEAAHVLQISPTQSSFVRAQHIDPAVLLKAAGVQISNLRGSINGVPLPGSYVAQCATAPNGQNRAAISCPNIVPLLTNGANHVELTVDLPNGAPVSSTVEWEVVE